MIVRHCPQGASGAGFLKKHAQQAHQHGGNHGGVQIFLVEQDASLKHTFKCDHRVFWHTHVNLVDVTAKNGLPHAVEKVANAQSRHQQGGAFLVDQMAQHHPLNQPGHHEHHRTRRQKSGDVGKDRVGNASPGRNPLGKARHRQRRKQHHGALRKIEHARRLVDQHKAKRHQRIQHASHQAAE